jgi:hypothetical protein
MTDTRTARPLQDQDGDPGCMFSIILVVIVALATWALIKIIHH